tara:strand:+ start:1154 stop:1909 length:756 start_codon:yes stop_codon:yes gene_type:complete
MPYSFLTRLPDPDQKIGWWGASSTSASADAGPGFSSVSVTSDQKVMVKRTNSQRVIAKGVAGHKWNIDIRYNPMTEAEFRPVSAFLEAKRGALTPFFVALPQYNTPTNAAWVTDLGNHTFTAASTHSAGATSIHIVGSNSYTINSSSNATDIPRPGEVFTIADSSDTNHTKVYMITHVETRETYATAGSRPSSDAHLRLGISPPLTRDVSTNGTLTFINPLFKVIMPSAVRKYSLNTDNLYSFSLKLEEYL